ncbi:MAG: hypothetical protein V1915_01820 [Candidatus Bathyarchaeota archaeon]
MLQEKLKEFNEGLSKTFYCNAVTVSEAKELENALSVARKQSEGLEKKETAKKLHQVLEEIAERNKAYLKLRKY